NTLVRTQTVLSSRRRAALKEPARSRLFKNIRSWEIFWPRRVSIVGTSHGRPKFKYHEGYVCSAAADPADLLAYLRSERAEHHSGRHRRERSGRQTSRHDRSGAGASAQAATICA